jgi:hypothetical protein
MVAEYRHTLEAALPPEVELFSDHCRVTASVEHHVAVVLLDRPATVPRDDANHPVATLKQIATECSRNTRAPETNTRAPETRGILQENGGRSPRASPFRRKAPCRMTCRQGRRQIAEDGPRAVIPPAPRSSDESLLDFFVDTRDPAGPPSITTASTFLWSGMDVLFKAPGVLWKIEGRRTANCR